MTTIACTRTEIGGDLQYTDGNKKFKGMPKVIQFDPHPMTYPFAKFYVGFSGVAEAIIAVAEFFSNPETTKPPKVKGLGGLILTEEKKIFVFDTYDKWLPVEQDFYAIGSGGPVALGALAAGASVKEALKVAAKHDAYTGLGVKIFTV